MKQTIFTLLLISVTGLMSCKKTTIQPTIKQFDQTQIQNYIAAHGITGMIRDTVGGDTTGLYYQVLQPATSTTPLQYWDKVAFVFTIRTFDGKYVQSDTIANHYDDFVGHIVTGKLPLGLQLAIHNDLKYPGASARLLIPSHLAYGVNGYGSGSIQVANSRIPGNACLDYYVHVIDNEPAYDDLVIKNYMLANNLSGYTKVQSTIFPGNYYYYSILTPGTGTDLITDNTSVTYTDTGQLFNGTLFDSASNGANTGVHDVIDFVPGVKEALENYAKTGTKISLLLPSALGYGGVPNAAIPPNSCLRFTFQIVSITP
jgi:FKBP-type peptidyl-prolyl cis-trans isomerase FkpA